MVTINLHLVTETKTFEYEDGQFAYDDIIMPYWQCYDDGQHVNIFKFPDSDIPRIDFEVGFVLDYGDGYSTMENLEAQCLLRKPTCKEKLMGKVCITSDIKKGIVVDGYLMSWEKAQEVEDLLKATTGSLLVDVFSSGIDNDICYVFVTDYNRNELPPILKELNIIK